MRPIECTVVSTTVCISTDYVLMPEGSYKSCFLKDALKLVDVYQSMDEEFHIKVEYPSLF